MKKKAEQKIYNELRHAKKEWTVLFIKDKGDPVVFKNFKTVFTWAVTIFLLSMLTSGILIFLYKKKSDEYRLIQKRLIATKKELTTVTRQREDHMARATFALSALEKLKNERKKKGKRAAHFRRRVEEGLDNPDMEVWRLELDRDPYVDILYVNFYLKKRVQGPDLITGYCFLVFKNEDPDSRRKGFSVPSVPMESGMPASSSYKRGRIFQMRNMKSMEFQTSLRAAKRLKAYVVVFDKTGRVVMEHPFSVGR